MTHSTLISTKYFTVPFFQAVNLISEGISHLAIIFWTIKPISEEQRLSGELYRPNYVKPFVSMSNTLFKWAAVVRAIVIHWHIIFRSLEVIRSEQAVLMWWPLASLCIHWVLSYYLAQLALQQSLIAFVQSSDKSGTDCVNYSDQRLWWH